MTRAVLVAGAVAALLAVFIVITVSVVDVRRPLDGRVSRSFNAVVATRQAGRALVEPRGCSLWRPYFYNCAARVQLNPRTAALVQWRILLSGDGCWATTDELPYPADPAFARLGPGLQAFRGCTG
jgi:hypothetical protein